MYGHQLTNVFLCFLSSKLLSSTNICGCIWTQVLPMHRTKAMWQKMLGFVIQQYWYIKAVLPKTVLCDVCISINKYKTARFASPRPIGARGHTQTHSLYCICISISKHKYRMERNTNLRSLFHHGDHVVVRGAAPMSGPREHVGAFESTLLNL